MTVRGIEVGEAVTFQVRGGPLSVEAKVPCEKNVGHWYCATHQKGFANQLEKDWHIGDGEHVLTWICWEHGPEQPQ